MKENAMPIGEIKIFIIAGSFASAMGLADKLRKGHRVTVKEVLQSLFVSAMAGLLIAFMSYKYMVVDHSQQYIFFGLCGLAGLGGHSVLDLCAGLLLRIIKQKSEVVLNLKDDKEGEK